MTSDKQVVANRKNALKSTGPKTASGKDSVKWNALKHGILSREVIIQDGDGQENKAEYYNLLGQLRDDLHPQGALEEMLIERIAVCYWRLGRVVRCEVGKIRKKLDTLHWDELQKRQSEFTSQKHYGTGLSSIRAIQNNSVGTKYLIGVLDKLRDEIRIDGVVSEYMREMLIEGFGLEEGSFAQSCLGLSRMAEKGLKSPNTQSNAEGDLLTPDKCQSMILGLIKQEEKRLVQLGEIVRENERLSLEAKTASLALPSKESIDKILRYETAIERQLYKAIDQLERLRRQREGEVVPPPINVEVSSGS